MSMALAEAVVLGIIWGLTAVWPVSAQAHTIVLPWAATMDPMSPAVRSGALLGGMLAVLVVQFRDVVALSRTLPGVLGSLSTVRYRPIFAPRRHEAAEDRLVRAVALLSIVTIPGAVVGLLAEAATGPWLRGDEDIRSLVIEAGLALIVGGGILWYADRADDEHRRLRHLSWRDAVILGLAQATAVLPGVSRMAAVLATARFQGVAREDSVRLALWSGIPIYLGAFVVSARRLSMDQLTELVCSGVASLVAGTAAIVLLRAIARNGRLTIFAVYRLIAGGLFLALALLAG